MVSTPHSGPPTRIPATVEMKASVLFFDGQCPLCSRLVAFMLWADRRGSLRFAPLKGKTAAQWLKGVAPLPDSVVLVHQDRVLLRSEALLTALELLGGVWFTVRLFRVIPRGWRDVAYDVVARNRARMGFPLGRARQACPLDGALHQGRMLP